MELYFNAGTQIYTHVKGGTAPTPYTLNSTWHTTIDPDRTLLMALFDIHLPNSPFTILKQVMPSMERHTNDHYHHHHCNYTNYYHIKKTSKEE